MLFKLAPTHIHNIMVVVDGTDTSDRAIDLAIDLAKSLRAKLTGVSIIETDTLKQLLNAKILTESEMGDFERGLEDSSHRQLVEAKTKAKKSGLNMETCIAKGNSEVTIPHEVRTRKIDMIVLGIFDSNKASRDLLIRQRQQIVDHAPCPVLVAR